MTGIRVVSRSCSIGSAAASHAASAACDLPA